MCFAQYMLNLNYSKTKTNFKIDAGHFTLHYTIPTIEDLEKESF